MKRIKFEEITHRVDEYHQAYNDKGGLVFEIPEYDYSQLQKLTKWYRQNRDFAKKMDTAELGEVFKNFGVENNSKVIFLFGFLMLVWHSNTELKAERESGCINLMVKKIVRH